MIKNNNLTPYQEERGSVKKSDVEAYGNYLGLDPVAHRGCYWLAA